jgi:protein-S-isoprenylcysteine O-methyltransferase Ste14
VKKNNWILLGQWLFRHRSFTPVPLLVLSLWAFQPMWYHPVPLLTGVVLALAGEGVRILAVGWSFGGTSGREAYLRADSLNTEGIYSLVRNPLYIGNIMIFLGLTLVYGNAWVVLIMTLFLVFQYLLIVSAEEQFLHEKYGQAYGIYTGRVNRFVPQNLSFVTPAHPFSWMKVLLKENDSVFNMGLVLLGILHYRFYQKTGAWGSAWGIWLPLAVWVLVYGLIKVYKRRNNAG